MSLNGASGIRVLTVDKFHCVGAKRPWLSSSTTRCTILLRRITVRRHTVKACYEASGDEREHRMRNIDNLLEIQARGEMGFHGGDPGGDCWHLDLCKNPFKRRTEKQEHLKGKEHGLI